MASSSCRRRRRSSSVILSAILLLLLLCSAANGDLYLLQETCKAAAASKYRIDYGFCVISLQAHPGSNFADAQGLAKIALTLSQANATSALAKVNRLEEGAAGKVKAALDGCSQIYVWVVSGLGSAAVAVEKASYKDAVKMLDAVKDQPSFCDHRFRDVGAVNPVAKEGGDVARLATLTLQLVSALG